MTNIRYVYVYSRRDPSKAENTDQRTLKVSTKETKTPKDKNEKLLCDRSLLCSFIGANRRLLNHPPHLKNGSAASALIPFCAFEGELMITKESSWLPNLYFPTCQLFIPTSLDGQLCYKLQVNKTTKGSYNREGLLLILDMNESLLVPLDPPNESHRNESNFIEFSSNLMTSKNGNDPKIHINTLRSFEAFGSGSYRLTSLKKLKGKRDFLSMSFSDKKCSLEDYEECRRKALLEKCQCVPWELRTSQVLFLEEKMKIKTIVLLFLPGFPSLFFRGQRLHQSFFKRSLWMSGILQRALC